MKNFYELKIFAPVVMKEKWADIHDAIEKMILVILLSKLTDEQRQFLEVKNYHYWDPNYPENGKVLGLLEFLIFDAQHAASTINTSDHFVSSINLLFDKCKKYTGVDDIKWIQKQVADINIRWNGIAKLDIYMESPVFGGDLVFHLL